MTSDPTPIPEPGSSAPHSRRRRRESRGTIPVVDRVERRAELLTVIVVGVVAFFVYLRTLSPGLHFGDGPEFAAAAQVLGVPHPTGYPLYMLLLKGWLVLTLAGDAIIRTTLFNAAVSAVSAGLATLILLDWFRALFSRWTDKPRLIAAASGALAGAFLRFHWSNAVVTEVYALQFLLTLGFIRSIQKFTLAPGPRPLAAAALFLGLGLAHHRMSLFLILPLALVWAWALRRRVLPSWRRPALLAALFIGGGLALYAYLPLRAAARPPINWGDPSTLSRFLTHVRGGEFVEQRFLRPVPVNPAIRFTAASYAAFAADEARQLLADFAGQLAPLAEQYEVNPLMGRAFARPTRAAVLLLVPLLALAALGAWHLVRPAPLLFAAVALLGAQNVVLLFLYNILDLRDYYLFPFWLGWVFVFAGLVAAIDLLVVRPSEPLRRTAALIPPPPPAIYALLLIPLLIAAANWRRCDRSGQTGAELMSALLLPESKELMPEGSVLLTAGDYDIFPAWYSQIVRGERPDVLIVGSNFLREPWYQAHFTPEQIAEYGLRFSGRMPRGPEEFVGQLAEGVLDANVGRRGVFTTTLIDAPTLRLLDQRYRLQPVADVAIPGLGDSPGETTVALVRISPKESKP